MGKCSLRTVAVCLTLKVLENMNDVMDFDSKAGEQQEMLNRWHSDGAL